MVEWAKDLALCSVFMAVGRIDPKRGAHGALASCRRGVAGPSNLEAGAGHVCKRRVRQPTLAMGDMHSSAFGALSSGLDAQSSRSGAKGGMGVSRLPSADQRAGQIKADNAVCGDGCMWVWWVGRRTNDEQTQSRQMALAEMVS